MLAQIPQPSVELDHGGVRVGDKRIKCVLVGGDTGRRTSVDVLLPDTSSAGSEAPDSVLFFMHTIGVER